MKNAATPIKERIIKTLIKEGGSKRKSLPILSISSKNRRAASSHTRNSRRILEERVSIDYTRIYVLMAHRIGGIRRFMVFVNRRTIRNASAADISQISGPWEK